MTARPAKIALVRRLRSFLNILRRSIRMYPPLNRGVRGDFDA